MATICLWSENTKTLQYVPLRVKANGPCSVLLPDLGWWVFLQLSALYMVATPQFSHMAAGATKDSGQHHREASVLMLSTCPRGYRLWAAQYDGGNQCPLSFDVTCPCTIMSCSQHSLRAETSLLGWGRKSQPLPPFIFSAIFLRQHWNFWDKNAWLSPRWFGEWGSHVSVQFDFRSLIRYPPLKPLRCSAH